MASNVRAKSIGYSVGSKMSSAEANTIDTNAARAVSRTATFGGLKTVAFTYMGKNPTSAASCSCSVASGTYRLHASTWAQQAWHSFIIHEMPAGHSVSQLNVYCLPSPGHNASPDYLPHVRIWSITVSQRTCIASVAYSWVSTAAYHAGLTLVATVATGAVTINDSSLYVLEFGTEGGAHATGSVELRAVAPTVSCATASGGVDFTFWRTS